MQKYFWFKKSRRYSFFSSSSTTNVVPDNGSGGGEEDNTEGNSGTTSVDFGSGGVFSWIAKGFENVGNFLSSLVKGIAYILDYLNPFSENFILKDLFKLLSDLLAPINPFSEKFIFKQFFIDFGDFISNFFSWFNPVSDNFFGKKLIELLSDLFNFLFVPSQDRFTAIQNTVSSKFDFIESIKTGISSIKDMLNGIGNVPCITLSLKATKYTNEMNLKVIDMNWYEPYKNYGDLIITGFVYISFIWRIYIKLSAIINGSAGGVDNYNDICKEVIRKW